MISFIVDFVANIILFVSGVYLLLWAIGTYGQWVERKRGKRRGKLPWSWEREKANHRNLHRVVSLFRAVREREFHHRGQIVQLGWLLNDETSRTRF